MILKGLGYRGEAKPEAEVMAMLPAKAAPVPRRGCCGGCRCPDRTGL